MFKIMGFEPGFPSWTTALQTTYTWTQNRYVMSITEHKKKLESWKVPKQDEDTKNLQILLHLRYLLWLLLFKKPSVASKCYNIQLK